MKSRLLLVLFLISPFAYSQDSEGGITINDFLEKTATLNISGAENFFSGPNSTVNVEISDDKKVATGKIALIPFMNNTLFTSLEIKAPFDKDSGESNFSDFDRFKDATTVTLGFDFVRINRLSGDSQDSAYTEALCDEYLLTDDSLQSCDYNSITTQAKSFFNTQSTLDAKQFVCARVGVDGEDCDENTFSEEWYRNYSLDRQAYYGPRTTALIVPVKLEYGQQTFNYLSELDYSGQKQSSEPYSASVGLGYLRNESFVGFGYERQRSFEPQAGQQICQPVSAESDAISCKSGAVGSPAESKKNIVFLEGRFRPMGSRYAFGLKISRDLKDDEHEISVPVYFPGSNSAKFNTGMNLNWDSKDKDFEVSFFFGTAFQFFDR